MYVYVCACVYVRMCMCVCARLFTDGRHLIHSPHSILQPLNCSSPHSITLNSRKHFEGGSFLMDGPIQHSNQLIKIHFHYYSAKASRPLNFIFTNDVDLLWHWRHIIGILFCENIQNIPPASLMAGLVLEPGFHWHWSDVWENIWKCTLEKSGERALVTLMTSDRMSPLESHSLANVYSDLYRAHPH